MAKGILRTLLGRGASTKTTRYYYWRCECGRSSQGGNDNQAHAEYLAYLHTHRMGVGHPVAEVYWIDKPAA
jgi:hypothetical protein